MDHLHARSQAAGSVGVEGNAGGARGQGYESGAKALPSGAKGELSNTMHRSDPRCHLALKLRLHEGYFFADLSEEERIDAALCKLI
jgi:hypothetical protein